MGEEEGMTRLYLIRHATNDALGQGLLIGRSPGIHLNAEGHAQAEALAERLAAVELNAVYSSPMERAVETAEPVARRHGLELKIHPGLNEVDTGQWTGLTVASVRRRRRWRGLWIHPAGVSFPRGETLWQVQVRVVQALENIRAAHRGGNVAVVCHADPIRVAVAHYLGLPLDLYRRLVISPASITILSFEREYPRLLRLNDTAHIGAEEI